MGSAPQPAVLQLLSCCRDTGEGHLTDTKGSGASALALTWPFILHTPPPPLRIGTKKILGKTHPFLGHFAALNAPLAFLCKKGSRPKAFKCWGQRFATCTAQSCATLPLHEPSGQQRGCQQRARRMQSPALTRRSARISLLLPEMEPTFLPCLFPPVPSVSCAYKRLLVLKYFATSSSTKSPARIALIVGEGNYLLEIIKLGASVASTLPAKFVVLTARAEPRTAALLSRKPRLVSDSSATQDKTSVLLSKK